MGCSSEKVLFKCNTVIWKSLSAGRKLYIYACVIWRIGGFTICCILEILNFSFLAGQKCSRVAMLNLQIVPMTMFQLRQLLLICQIRSLFYVPKPLLTPVPEETAVWLEESWGWFPTSLIYLPLLFIFSIYRALLLQVPAVNSDLVMIGLLFSYLSWVSFSIDHRFANLTRDLLNKSGVRVPPVINLEEVLNMVFNGSGYYFVITLNVVEDVCMNGEIFWGLNFLVYYRLS